MIEIVLKLMIIVIIGYYSNYFIDYFVHKVS